MADLTTKPVLSVCATVGSKLSDLVIKDGQLIFVQDKHKIALDFNGKRTFYNQIEELATEDARTAMLAPIKGAFYFVLDTGILWTYQSDWVQITTPPKDVTAFPLDTRCYFTDLDTAKAAAATATEVGDTSSIYCYGMKLLVDDGVNTTWYVIQRDGTLLEEGYNASAGRVNATIENGVLVLGNLTAVPPVDPESGKMLYVDTTNKEILAWDEETSSYVSIANKTVELTTDDIDALFQ